MNKQLPEPGVFFRRNLMKIVREGRKAMLPPADITVSEWADKYRMLPETSVEPGRWRTERLPHSRAIMDAVNKSGVRQISVMGSAQIGKTEIMNNIIGYIIDIDPAGVIVMQPTDQDARDYSLQKLEPMIEDTPVLRAKVSRKKARDTENNTLRKKFIGGYLTIVSGGSKSATRQRSARVTIGDDIDAIDLNAKEGDPIMRLIKRSTTYPDHLNINISTPTLEGTSRIEALFNQSNKQRWHVKCPECLHLQVMNWERLTWDKEEDMFGKVIKQFPETAKYPCENCGVLWGEKERLAAIAEGVWIAERPWISHHQGFWINELASTLSSMAKVAAEIVSAASDEEKLESLYNTVLGLPYSKVRGEETDPTGLMERLEDYIQDDLLIPNEVLLLTAAVDVQAGSSAQANDPEKGQRLEILVMGWGLGKERWVVYREKILGNIKKADVWNKLDELHGKYWMRKDGYQMKIHTMFVDSGYEAQQIYEYTRTRGSRRIFASKGAAKHGAPLLPNKLYLVDKGRTYLISVGSQAAKHEIFGCLNNVKEPGPKYTHFTRKYCNADFFKQLTSEVAVRRNTGLFEYVYFVKKKPTDSNEILDLMVLNLAAMEYSNANFESIKRRIDKIVANVDEMSRKKSEEEKKVIQLQKKESTFETVRAGKLRRRQNFVNSW